MSDVSESRVAVIIPALNEEGSIAAVIDELRAADPAQLVVVADNGSEDATAAIAAARGARVVSVPERGYGYACRAGVDAAPDAGVLVFIDGDGSMAAADVASLVAPILAGTADVVCGVRPVGRALMPVHQRAGNRVIALLLRRHGVRLPELCPLRAVRATTLVDLNLPGSRYAWPAQMLARAARHGARITTVPVTYRPRMAGRSKVGGSLRGSLLASWDIAGTLLREQPVPRR